MDQNFLEQYKEKLQNLKYKNISYYDIYKLVKDQNITKLSDTEHISSFQDTFFILETENDFHLFYKTPIIFTCDNSEKMTIFSTLEIDDYMKKNSILSLILKTSSDETLIEKDPEQELKIIYPKNKNYFYAIKSNNMHFECFERKNLITNETKEYELKGPKEFSKFFFDYFEYNDPKEIKDFILFFSKGRNNFIRELTLFFYDETQKFFKFCGPSSIGKSTTLIIFRNIMKGVIYFNFKVINKFEKEGKPYKHIIYDELNHLKFFNDEEKNNFNADLNNIFFKTTIEDCILGLFKSLSKITVRNIIIFDQFRPYYFRKNSYKKIEEIVKKSQLKLILSSSINDKDIKYEIIKAMKKSNNLPYKISINIENYYLYILDLIDFEDLKTFYVNQYQFSEEEVKIIEQFNFYPKYIYLFNKNKFSKDTLTKIDNQIINKIKNLFDNEFSLEVIVRIILTFLNKQFNYSHENINILHWIPLKYFNIYRKGDKFYIDYSFPYIKSLFNSISDKYNIKNYFEEKLYNKDTYEQFKGPYFEKFIKITITNNCKKFFGADITHFITVDNLMNLEELDNQYNDIIKLIDNINNKIDKKELIKDVKNKIDKNELITYQQFIQNKIELINKKLKEFNIEPNENSIEFYFKASLKEELEKYTKIITNKDKRNLGRLKKLVKKTDYSDDFKNGGILIDQRQVNGRCIDSVFLSGHIDNKRLICLQMKFYMPDTNLSTEFTRNTTKSNLRKSCQKLLANAFLQFGITIKEWYYFFVFHYNQTENQYNVHLVNMCQKNDLDYIFFDPILKSFYNKNFEKIQTLPFNHFSNFDFEALEDNPFSMFNETLDYQYLFKKRNKEKELTKSIISDNTFNDIVNKWEKSYNLSFSNFFMKIKENFPSIKNIKIVSLLKMNEREFPSLKKGYGFIFLDNEKKNLILYANLKDGNITVFRVNNNEEIIPIQIGKFIYSKINLEYFVIKLY